MGADRGAGERGDKDSIGEEGVTRREQGVGAPRKILARAQGDAISGLEGAVHVAGLALEIGAAAEGGMGSIIEVISGDDGEEVIRGEDVAGAAIAVDPAVGVEIAAAPHVDDGAGLGDDGAAGETHLFAGDASCGDVVASGIDPGTAIEGNAEGNEDVSSGDRIVAGDGGDAVRSEGEKIGRGGGRGGAGDFIDRSGPAAIPAKLDRADGGSEGAVLPDLAGVNAELSASRKRQGTRRAARKGDAARSADGIVGEDVEGAKGGRINLSGLEGEIADHLEGPVAADIALGGIQVR